MITRRILNSYWPDGDGSTLSLDFTTGVLDPLLTFTRSGTGTFVNASGLVATASTDTPRFDHDPTTGSPKGLLIEGTATNLLTRSQALATSPWSAGNGSGGTLPTVDNDNDTAPDGTQTATRVQLNITGGGFSRVQQLVTGTIGVSYTFSVWMKLKSGSTPVTVAIRVGSDGTSTNTNKTVTSSWQRFQTTYTLAAAPADAQVMLWTSLSTSTTADVLVWGAQLETGSGASSYIPTGASQGTRNADECSMTGTDFSSWFNATEGTFLAHARRMRTTNVGRIASANDNTANESIDIGASTTGQFIVTDGGSALATITPGTVTANTAFKIAGAFKLDDVQAALGGTLGTPDTGVTMPTVNRLMIGRQAGGSPVYLNGTVSLLKFWPTRLPDSQLQSLTT